MQENQTKGKSFEMRNDSYVYYLYTALFLLSLQNACTLGERFVFSSGVWWWWKELRE